MKSIHHHGEQEDEKAQLVTTAGYHRGEQRDEKAQMITMAHHCDEETEEKAPMMTIAGYHCGEQREEKAQVRAMNSYPYAHQNRADLIPMTTQVLEDIRDHHHAVQRTHRRSPVQQCQGTAKFVEIPWICHCILTGQNLHAGCLWYRIVAELPQHHS
jgi:hypothetical protein